jgi:predicted site-specific integrase-resolvase
MEDFKKAFRGRKILFDIGSGVDFKRRNFQEFLKQAFEADIEGLAIKNKERLC